MSLPLLFPALGLAHPLTSRMYFLCLPNQTKLSPSCNTGLMFKMSCNTDPLLSNFCCGKTEPRRSHSPPTTRCELESRFIFLHVGIHLIQVCIYYFLIKTTFRDFTGGSVERNLSASAGDTGSTPGPERSHTPWSS